MSDCSTNAFKTNSLDGFLRWKSGLSTPLTFARYANGEERQADYFELDGEVFERVVHCAKCMHYLRSKRCGLTDEPMDANDYCSCGEVDE